MGLAGLTQGVRQMSKPVIAIHGGAGAITRAALSAEKEQEYIQALSGIVAAGQQILAQGGSALDAVTEAVRLLEECPLFNAGKGSVFTHQGTHELDACVMDGRTCDAGAVAGVSRIRNPILAARAVLENSQHVLFAGEGAEKFATAHGLEMVAPDFFFTQSRFDQLHRAQAEQGRVLLDHDGAEPIDPDSKFGTVGAVALDALGNLAAATSTGGMTNKQAGRVGDTPIIGAGCYANNATVAVSSTGTGEIFMRGVAAYDVSALMEYAGLSLQQASDRVVMEKLLAMGGSGGMIAIDSQGNVALPFNSEGMYRGFGYVGDAPSVGIYR
ncbi:Isoaspartyl peptidase precursor [Serratia proteamaculans]|nr:Isoaspartyl peptidase precursor [Serratia proteamaculans]CAI1531788.1 Isoaspartyl peptidase precursor [Serratia proteamaculans]CAI1559778.1 Isoaspartyl peptidase precursor [Serratia proteamaculans]CAI1564722.1 Isoaspartyl peptidase precursor [Serratia proteamaculans]CAI1670936.1 Isoaspartyl peptidase precursor [Serratia proteamaculans]